MYGFVYATTNKINGKKYIGMCSFDKVDGNYLGSGKILKFAIKKYGRKAFEREILQECDTREELEQAEKMWIEKMNAVISNDFYNIIEGGIGGNSTSLEKYWGQYTPEERRALRNWSKQPTSGMQGKRHTDETKEKIGSKSIDRNWNKPNHNGSNNPRARRCKVVINNKELVYDCLRDCADEMNIPYPTLKSIARRKNTNNKYGVTEITYL